MPPLVGPHGEHVLHAIAEDRLDVLAAVAPEGKSDHLDALREQEALAEVIVQPHDLRRLEELLLREVEHARRPLAAAGARPREDVPDRTQQVGGGNPVLDEIVVRAAFHGLRGHTHVVEPGLDDDGHIGRVRLDTVERIQLLAVGQHEIQQHDVDALRREALDRSGQRLGRDHGELRALRLRQQRSHELRIERVVLDEQDGDGVIDHFSLEALRT